ncbi:MAG: MFS transporter [Candidatus Eisenbacteria sp.]|nr:MFS transporter [Candidatus Eisenbacteria bacterium]
MKTGIPARVFRISLAAFITDFSLYLVWTAIPFKAVGLGASPAVLGLMPAVASSTYVLTTAFAGRLSDRVSRLLLARLGCLLYVAGCLLVMQARTIGEILPFLPLIGLGMGFFWPPIQAAVADEGKLKFLERNIGLFNIMWSSGKALGFLLAGVLYAMFGPGPIFILASAVMLGMVALIPGTRRAEVEEEDSGGYERVSPRDLLAFMRMAWVANAVAFGVGHTMNTQYPKLMVEIGLDSRSFGIYLAAIFVVQTAVFVLLRSYRGWRFRRLPAYAVHFAMGLAVVLVSFAKPFPLILLSAIPLGLGLGLAYHASITYSLAGHGGRGRRAGIHESLLGAGNLLIPFIGGLLASGVGDLRVPYWFCGVVIAGSLIAQEVIWRKTRSQGSSGKC